MFRWASIVFIPLLTQRTMADPVQRPSTDSGASSKTTVTRTRGGKATAAAAAAPPATKTRRKGGSASPDKKPAGSAGARAAGRASTDRASAVANAPSSVAEDEEQPRKAKRGKKGGEQGADAAAADRASVAADALDIPPAEDDEAKPSSAEAAPCTAKPEKGEAAAPDPSPAFLKAQVRMICRSEPSPHPFMIVTRRQWVPRRSVSCHRMGDMLLGRSTIRGAPLACFAGGDGAGAGGGRRGRRPGLGAFPVAALRTSSAVDFLLR